MVKLSYRTEAFITQFFNVSVKFQTQVVHLSTFSFILQHLMIQLSTTSEFAASNGPVVYRPCETASSNISIVQCIRNFNL